MHICTNFAYKFREFLNSLKWVPGHQVILALGFKQRENPLREVSRENNYMQLRTENPTRGHMTSLKLLISYPSNESLKNSWMNFAQKSYYISLNLSYFLRQLFQVYFTLPLLAATLPLSFRWENRSHQTKRLLLLFTKLSTNQTFLLLGMTEEMPFLTKSQLCHSYFSLFTYFFQGLRIKLKLCCGSQG